MSTNVPDMHIARSGQHGAGQTVYRGSSVNVPAPLVAVSPVPQTTGTDTRGRRTRVVGLVPAHAGAQFPLVTEAKEKPSAVEISRARAQMNTARATQRAAEMAWASTQAFTPGGDPEKLRAAREAGEAAAIIQRRVAELEDAYKGKSQTVITEVRDPQSALHAFDGSNYPYKYVCFHANCRRDPHHKGAWASEADLRNAPEHNPRELAQRQECHVFAVLSEAPMDPIDPHGERVGYVAPRGRDGSILAPVGTDPHADTVEDLRLQVQLLMEQVADLTAGKKK
jgi:hypothetical protein